MFKFGFTNLSSLLLILAAESIHLRNCKPKHHFISRLSVSLAFACAIALILPEATGETPVPYVMNSLFSTLVFSTTVYVAIIVLSDEPFYLLNRCLYGYLTYTSAYLFCRLADAIFPSSRFYHLIYVVIFIASYSIFLFFSLRQERARQSRINWHMQTIVLQVLVVAAFSYVTTIGSLIRKANIPVLFLIVYLSFLLMNMFSDKKRLSDEYELLRQLMDKEAKQYEISKELIDSVNIKAHDLKHQLRHLRNSGAVIDSEALREIEDAVEEYDAGFKTGNDALDIIMAETSRQCIAGGIRIVCVTKGELLNFMEPKDIYSLMGNILTNAIEAVKELPDEDKRTINLSITQDYGMIRIRCENYYEGELKFNNGIPETTKGSVYVRGYGTRSIRLICEKYSGDVDFIADADTFTVNAMLPLVESA